MGEHVRQGRGHRPLSTIGVAGCGRMGLPMLQNVIAAGFNARGFDVRDVGVSTDRDVFADGLTTLISVVRDADETDALLFKNQAMVSVTSLDTIIISSTLSPNYVKGLRDRVPDHIRLVDAPMSGAQVKARSAELSFMLGGDTAGLEPLFAAMGTSIHHMGDFGAGMSAKVLNNLLAASNTAMTRLVLDWADATGVDEGKLLKLIDASSGQNWLASGFDDIEFARDGYADHNTIGILYKDVAAALDIAPNGANTALPERIQDAIKSLKPRP